METMTPPSEYQQMLQGYADNIDAQTKSELEAILSVLKNCKMKRTTLVVGSADFEGAEEWYYCSIRKESKFDEPFKQEFEDISVATYDILRYHIMPDSNSDGNEFQEDNADPRLTKHFVNELLKM